jgi:hypothetical protein
MKRTGFVIPLTGMPALCVLLPLLLCPAAPQADVGDVLEITGTPGTCPTGLTWDGEALWVADRKLDLICRLDPKGRGASSFKSPGYYPAGLAWDGSRIWNVDRAEKMI